MKMIKLQGINCLYAFVDDEDYDDLMKYRWYSVLLEDRTPVHRYIPAKERHLFITKNTVYLHRWLTKTHNAGRDVFIDHIDRNPLNNQKHNLRIANASNNCFNRTAQTNNIYSKFKGVTWCKKTKKYRAQIGFNKKHYSLGRFTSEKDAALVYNLKAKELFGEFAYLNVIE